MEKIPKLNYLQLICSVIFITAFSYNSAESGIHPNGGENGEFWEQNSTRTIRWDTSGLSGYVNISIWNINTATYTVIDTNLLASEGEYEWLIPSTHPTGNYFRIKVQKTDDELVYQMSESFFPIYEESFEPVKTTVEESKKNDEIVQVYPNPVKNELNFSFTKKVKAQRGIIYNISGEKVIEQLLQESGPYTINTAGLAPGKYFLKVQLKDGSFETTGFVVEK